jgi:hypothetical protein
VILFISTSTGIVMNNEITIASQLHLIITNVVMNRLWIIIAVVTTRTMAMVPAATENVKLEFQITAMSTIQSMPSTAALGNVAKVIGRMMMVSGHASTRSIARNQQNAFIKESSGRF